MWKEYFLFTKSERRGILALIVLIIISVSLSFLYDLLKPHKQYDHTQFSEDVLRFEAGLQLKDSSFFVQEKLAHLKLKYDTIDLKLFDPNTASTDELHMLGLSEKQVRSILNYRRKGGRFFKKADFAKMYTISPEQYEILEPYISLVKVPEKTRRRERSQVGYTENNDPCYAPFDPNTATDSIWQQLGFSKKQTKSIQNYRSKIGGFLYKEDLKKLFVINDSLYRILAPFVQLPSKPVQQRVSFDLNIATKDQLDSVPGVGAYLAERIVKYRNRLGGYVGHDQLDEVYGMKLEAALKLKEYTFIVSGYHPEKIQVNFADVRELSAHVYISYQLAQAIVEYRDDYGPFKQADELLKIDLMSQGVLHKLKAYLTF